MIATRRKFLLSTSLASLGLAGYSYHRGVRFPNLSWEPPAPSPEFTFTGANAVGQNLIQTNTKNTLRAFAPEPKLKLIANDATQLTMTVHNIANDAELLPQNRPHSVSEQVSGITRTLTLTLKRGDDIELQWKLPKASQYKFASIGDTGGNQELGWCLQRANDLGAKFLLHLGDFNYQKGDYQSAIDHFNNSPIPVYVSIGNHDFHEKGLLHHRFTKEIGPLNHSFSIGRTRFANIDTAASTLPYSAGYRGKLLNALAQHNEHFTDTVAFTHRPLYDPVAANQDNPHDIGSDGERDWLIGALKRANTHTLLSGHIHIYDRSEFNGIDNIIVGQGLGHQDLIVNNDHSKMAIGQVDADGKVSYSMAPLAMPMALHCHPRTDVVKQSLREMPHWSDIQAIDEGCQVKR